MLSLTTVRGWKDNCAVAVCLLEELWAAELAKIPDRILAVLSQFDVVITSCHGSVEAFEKEFHIPCHYHPPGVDALRFSPFPGLPARSIEFLSIGRRSADLHKKLLALSEKDGLMYQYDTLIGPRITDPAEHRLLLANLAMRSKYFLVNPAKFNVQKQTEGQSEIGYRFFEGAAAGTIMLGVKPQNEIFDKYFHWRDAVIEIPFDVQAFEAFWRKLDSRPECTDVIRKNNIYYSLMEHDWVHRWRAILNLLSMPPKDSLIERERVLRQRAEMVLA